MSGSAASIPVGVVESGSRVGNGEGDGEDAGGGADEGEGDDSGDGEGDGDDGSDGEGDGVAAVEAAGEAAGTSGDPGVSGISTTDSPSDSPPDPAFDSAFDSWPGSEGLSDEIDEFTPLFSVLRGGPATFAATIPIIISATTIPRAMMITNPALLITLIIIFKIPVE